MRITKSKLKQIIKEELQVVLKEQPGLELDPSPYHSEYGKPHSKWFKAGKDIDGDFVIFFTDQDGMSHSDPVGYDSLDAAIAEAESLFNSGRKPKEVSVYSKVESRLGKGNIWGKERR
jgi:hypothetical protein